jgi:asparagine synthetase B (glutamine-hydrolysing)
VRGFTGSTGQHLFREISKLNELQVHHSPDDSGDFLCQGSNFTIQLGMRWLAIVSEHGSRQPIISEDGKLYRHVCGEVFNASQLQSKLESVNIFNFESSHSDTEVSMYALVDWDEGYLSKINEIISFTSGNQSKQGTFYSEEVNSLLKIYFKGKKDNTKYIWIISVFRLWLFIRIEFHCKKLNLTVTYVILSAR